MRTDALYELLVEQHGHSVRVLRIGELSLEKARELAESHSLRDPEILAQIVAQPGQGFLYRELWKAGKWRSLYGRRV